MIGSLFPPDLSWTHYRSLLKAPNPAARSFYEIEALRHSWFARVLYRQTNSLLFERLANQRLRPQQPTDTFEDPIFVEFLGQLQPRVNYYDRDLRIPSISLCPPRPPEPLSPFPNPSASLA